MTTSFMCGSSGPMCSEGEVCAIVLGQPTCQPGPDCQVFCEPGDAGVPNSCAIMNVCPDESAKGEVFNAAQTTCSGTGAMVTITCAYN